MELNPIPDPDPIPEPTNVFTIDSVRSSVRTISNRMRIQHLRNFQSNLAKQYLLKRKTWSFPIDEQLKSVITDCSIPVSYEDVIVGSLTKEYATINLPTAMNESDDGYKDPPVVVDIEEKELDAEK